MYESWKGRLKLTFFVLTGQVSYYFSDANLKVDEFMQKLTKTNEENSEYEPGMAPVKIEELLKFNKMKKLTEDVETVIQSFVKYSENGIVKFNTELILNRETNTISRKNAFIYEDSTDNVMFIETKFDIGAKNTEDCYDFVMKMFSNFGTILSVRCTFVDFDKSNLFYGFIEFDNCDTVENIVSSAQDISNNIHKHVKECIEKYTPIQNDVLPLKILSFKQLSQLKKSHYKTQTLIKNFKRKLFNKFARDHDEFERLFNKRKFEKPLKMKKVQEFEKKSENIVLKSNLDGSIIKFEAYSNNIECLNIKKIKQAFQSFIKKYDLNNIYEYFHIEPTMFSITEYPNCKQIFYIRTKNSDFIEMSSKDSFLNDFKLFFNDNSLTDFRSNILTDEETKSYWECFNSQN